MLALVGMLAGATLAGCGGSRSAASTTAASAQRLAHKGVRTIALTSTGIHNGRLLARYTCDGSNISPPLRWGAVPAGIGEVVLFALGITPHRAVTVEWAMAGLAPALHGVGAGQVPGNAFLVTASDGSKRYSICPPRGQTKRYRFAIYALPKGVIAGPKVSGPRMLRNLVEGPPRFLTPAYGFISATYTREPGAI